MQASATPALLCGDRRQKLVGQLVWYTKGKTIKDSCLKMRWKAGANILSCSLSSICILWYMCVHIHTHECACMHIHKRYFIKKKTLDSTLALCSLALHHDNKILELIKCLFWRIILEVLVYKHVGYFVLGPWKKHLLAQVYHRAGPFTVYAREQRGMGSHNLLQGHTSTDLEASHCTLPFNGSTSSL